LNSLNGETIMLSKFANGIALVALLTACSHTTPSASGPQTATSGTSTPTSITCETPMPAVVSTDSPSSAPSPTQAAYLGMWNGQFSGPAGRVCARLAVQHIASDGSVQLTYANEEFTISRGGANPPAVIPAQSVQYVGNIDNAGLHFTTKLGNKITMMPTGNDQLAATALLTSGSTSNGTFMRQK
jgi:hypothetical protein